MMPAARSVAGLLVLALAALTLATCEEFEPFEPVRSEAPFRFFGAGPEGAAVFLTEVAVTDSTVRIQLRARDVERLTAVAFELGLEPGVATIDTALPGDFFQPGTPTVFELAMDPVDASRWPGVMSLTDYSTDVSGGGLLATLVIRRTVDDPFDVPLGFDTEATRIYGDAGAPTGHVAVGGRLVYDPGSTATRP